MPINKKNVIQETQREILQRPYLPTLLLHVFFTVWWIFIGQASRFIFY